jgi:ketosteroid isomerase-like protein
MSQENLDTFSRGTDAFNRRDFDAWLAELDPEVEWQSALPILLTAGGGVYRGHEDLREMLREIGDTLDELTVEYSEIRDLGDRVLAIGQLHTRGNLSGAATESPFAVVSDFKNGKTIRVRTYLDPQEALEAAGLQE